MSKTFSVTTLGSRVFAISDDTVIAVFINTDKGIMWSVQRKSSLSSDLTARELLVHKAKGSPDIAGISKDTIRAVTAAFELMLDPWDINTTYDAIARKVVKGILYGGCNYLYKIEVKQNGEIVLVQDQDMLDRVALFVSGTDPGMDPIVDPSMDPNVN